jgi:hypothetical protein
MQEQRTTPCPAAPSGPSQLTLFQLAWQEAERHKWIESEKAGRDLGEDAIRDWSRRYFRRWCRDRWIEHLNGDRFWSELDKEDFGLLQREFHTNNNLTAAIVTRIKSGGENLDIIQWSIETSESLDETLEILRLLDINSRRLTFYT